MPAKHGTRPLNPIKGSGADGPPDDLGSDPAFLSAILEVADVLIVVLDRSGRILFVNRTCERITGYSVGELRGMAIESLLLPDEVDAVRGVFARIVQGEYPIRHTNHWVGKGGRRRLIRWSNTAMTKPDGSVAWVIGTGTDISPVKRAGESLHEVRQRAQAVLETAVDGVVVIDEQGIIETFNPAAERIFGFSAAEVMGRKVNVLMPSPHREQHEQYLRRYLETGEKRIIGIGREVAGRRKSGEIFPMELAVGETRVPGKRLFTGMVRDISDRRRAEGEARKRLDELAHASRLAVMGEMASGVAHELNQPLAAIVSFADACLRMEESGKLRAEALHDALRQIAEQGERAGRILRQLRQFVRKTEVTYAPIDLNEIVHGVLHLLEHEIRQRQVRVQADLEHALPTVCADRLQIEQVVLNLVHNAIDAMPGMQPADATLYIRTHRSEARAVAFTIRDSGVGLSHEVEKRLFEPFYTTKPQGLGMGLSISRSIIEAHGGRLSASRNPERGATFTFSLPVAEERGS